jgi:hypothetical protein
MAFRVPRRAALDIAEHGKKGGLFTNAGSRSMAARIESYVETLVRQGKLAAARSPARTRHGRGPKDVRPSNAYIELAALQALVDFRNTEPLATRP